MAAESDGAATKTAERPSPNDGPSKTGHTPVRQSRSNGTNSWAEVTSGDWAQGSEEQYLQKCERTAEAVPCCQAGNRMAAESDGAATKTAERPSSNDGPLKTGHTPVRQSRSERHEQLGRGDKRRLAQGSEEQYLQKCER
ncbi:hypothetical protein MRX96_030091 [Rhipicephalus microplus]